MRIDIDRVQVWVWVWVWVRVRVRVRVRVWVWVWVWVWIASTCAHASGLSRVVPLVFVGVVLCGCLVCCTGYRKRSHEQDQSTFSVGSAGSIPGGVPPRALT